MIGELRTVHRVSNAEAVRLSSLYRYGVLDTPLDAAFETVVHALAERLDVAVVRLVFADAQRWWCKSSVGPAVQDAMREAGILETLLTGGPAIRVVADCDGGCDTSPLPVSEPRLRSFAGLRILSFDGEELGVLYVADPQPRAFDAGDLQVLATACGDLQTLLEQRRRDHEDEATGALHGVAFLDQARRLAGLAAVSGQRVSLVTLDLAPFRTALDTRGEGLGTLALRLMADLGRTKVRRRDSFGRLSDNVFAVLVTDTRGIAADALAKRLSAHVAQGWTEAGLDIAPLRLCTFSVPATGLDFAIADLLLAATTDRDPGFAALPLLHVA